jgi:hypothetical protein
MSHADRPASCDYVVIYAPQGTIVRLETEALGGNVMCVPIESVASRLDVAIEALACVVVSPGDRGISGATEEDALRALAAHTSSPIIFLLYDELDEDEQAEVLAFTNAALELLDFDAELCSGGMVELLAVIDKALADWERLARARDARMRAAAEKARSLELAVLETTIKTDLADYLNLRLRCDAVAKDGQRTEAAVARSYADAVERLNEGALNMKLRAQLDEMLQPVKPPEWVGAAPAAIADILSRWQADQVGNMLLDIRRHAETPITFERQEVSGGVEIHAAIHPPDLKQKVEGALRIGGSALLTKVAVATFIPFLAPIAIPAAFIAGAATLLQINQHNTTIMRERFLRDIAAEMSVACREAILSARKHLQITYDLVRDAIRSDTASHLQLLLQSDRAMSDDEAKRKGSELKQLMLGRALAEPQ